MSLAFPVPAKKGSVEFLDKFSILFARNSVLISNDNYHNQYSRKHKPKPLLQYIISYLIT
jgi:hypothetical protein